MKVILSTSGGTDDLVDTVVVTAEVIGRSSYVEFYVDGTLHTTETTAPQSSTWDRFYSFPWDTTLETAGAHELKARAFLRTNYVEETLDVTVGSQDPPAAPTPVIQGVPVLVPEEEG